MRLRTQEDAGVRIQQCDAEGSNETKLKTKKWSEIEKQIGKLKVTTMDQHEGDVLWLELGIFFSIDFMEKMALKFPSSPWITKDGRVYTCKVFLAVEMNKLVCEILPPPQQKK